MNYGESYDGGMGDYALASATAAHTQLKKVFGLSDAAQVRKFSEERDIAWVSMWSTFRDQQCGDDASADDAATDCSGVKQEDGEFTEAFSG